MLETVLQAIVGKGAEIVEVDGTRRSVRFGGDEYDSGPVFGVCGGLNQAIVQQPVDQHPVGQKVHGEHQLVTLG